MSALYTDKFKKLSKRWVGQIGAAGVADAVTGTIPLASVTNLATDTAVVITIDRVDANGTATPNLEETCIGVVSGTNIINSVRAAEGTAQAHNAGAVVEILVTAKGWNDLVDGLLVSFNQSGYLGGSVVVASNIAASAIASGNLNFSLNSSIITTTQYAPQGFLINGKIVPSVSSNNLTVAIKGMDGNNPSASNPVYCRIGDTVRTITAALSVTKNAATNWFNSGSAELATQEVDYFVYLGYNATDGVVIGFSRIPSARQYSDFSVTTTNEKYAAISTITTAASTDYYQVIGRFAATLSAGAGYTWTVPTFTAINLIQRPIYETRVLSYTPSTGTWTLGNGTKGAKYKIDESGRVHVWVAMQADTTTTFAGGGMSTTVPFTSIAQLVANNDSMGGTIYAQAGGVVYNGISFITAASATISFYKTDSANTAWTNTVPGTWAANTNNRWSLSLIYFT